MLRLLSERCQSRLNNQHDEKKKEGTKYPIRLPTTILRSVRGSALPFRTIGHDVLLAGRAEAEVVKGEKRVAPVRRQVGQQFQSSGHPKDAQLAVLCARDADQQPQPQAQRAPTDGRGLGPARLGHRHRWEGLQEVILRTTEGGSLGVSAH